MDNRLVLTSVGQENINGVLSLVSQPCTLPSVGWCCLVEKGLPKLFSWRTKYCTLIFIIILLLEKSGDPYGGLTCTALMLRNQVMISVK